MKECQVYVTPNGRRYHTSKGCYRVLWRDPATFWVLSLRQAEDYGILRCKNCP